MAYDPILNTEIDLDSPITESLMTRMRDNPIAIADGDVGAPRIKPTALNTALETFNFTLIAANSSGTVYSQTSSAGEYGFYPRTEIGVYSGGAASLNAWMIVNNGAQRFETVAGGAPDIVKPEATYIDVWGIATVPASAFFEVTVKQRYMESSKPYNLGDGEIDLFIWLFYKNGTLAAIHCSESPPWVYNGKTKCRPDHVEHVFDNEGELIEVKKYVAEKINEPSPPWEGGDSEIYHAWLMDDDFQGENYELHEITTDRKNADMNDIPHPFQKLKIPVDFDETGEAIFDDSPEEIVLIDPVSPILKDLLALHNQERDIGKMIMNNQLTVGDIVEGRCLPPGDVCRSISWGGE